MTSAWLSNGQTEAPGTSTSSRLESVGSIDIQLNHGDDSTAAAACCANGGAGVGPNTNCCNLRSAVAFCAQQPSNVNDMCNVQLMPRTMASISASRGQLELGAGLANRMSVVGPGNITSESTSAQHSRMFYFNARLPAASLSLSDLSVAHFGGADIDGGAMWLSGEVAVSLSLVTFEDNSGKDGGSVWVSENSRGVKLDRCIFLRSVAAGSGGGIFVEREVSGVVVQDSTFDSCVSSAKLAEGGGGMYFNQSNSGVRFESSTFTSCSAGNSGGALFFGQNNSDVSFKSSTFTNCSAEKKYGGALYFDQDNSDVSFESSTFTSCSAEIGAGGALFFYESNSNVSFESSTFTNCSAEGGGALFFQQGNSNISFESSTFTSCSAEYGYGGALLFDRNNYDVIFVSSIFTSCSARIGYGGGALYFNQNNSDVSFESSTFTSCSAGVGGALVFQQGNSDVSFESSTFTNCSAENKYGGALYFHQSNSDVSFESSTFTSCSAEGGGALYFDQSNSDVSFESSTFTSCCAGQRGGAIYLNAANDDFVFENSHFISNTAGDRVNNGIGGAIYAGKNNMRMALLGDGVERRFWNVPRYCLELDKTYTTSYTFPGDFDEFVVLFSPDIFFGPIGRLAVRTESKTTTFAQNGYFPGVNTTALIVPGPSLTLSLEDNAINCVNCPGTYGDFPVYIYGIPRAEKTNDTVVTSFSNNVADIGGAVALLQANNAAVVVNVQITGNRAETGSGGGIYLETANSYSSFIRTHFVRNEAALLGGGLAVEVSHSGVQVGNCSFVSNSASSGGGLGVSTLNGVDNLQGGSFPTDFGASVSQSQFSSNSAVEGGAIYSLTTNALVVSDSDIWSNVASSSGGGCFLGSSSQVLVQGSVLSANSAPTGGAMYTGAKSQLSVTSCDVMSNTATISGGGMFLDSVAQLTFQDTVRLTSNSAGQHGGGLFLLDTPAWTASSSSSSIILEIALTSNNATWGSAVFFNASDAVTQQGGLTHMSLSSNHALSGGTIFWVARRNKSSTALDINSSTNTWGDNVAAYGEQVATQVVQFGGVSDKVNISSSPDLLAPFVFTVLDYYDQKVKQNASVVSTEVGPAPLCGVNVPSFVNSTGSLPVNSGVANFSSVLARCTPSGSMVVQYSTATQVFVTLTTTVSYAFSPCQAGDTYVQGTCTPCPGGQFSLSYTGPSSTKCLPCNVISGVSSCSGDDLVLEPGYWRQSATTSSVVQCQQLGGHERCTGGESTGDASCKLGSEGPLCGVCSDGYFAGYSGDCFDCGSSSRGVSSGVVVILFILGLAVAFCLTKWACATEERKSDDDDDGDGDNDNGGEIRFRSHTMQWVWERKKELLIKLKIIVVTIQVVSSIPSTVDIKPPSSLLNFFGLFNFLSFDYATIIPFECWIEYDYVDILLVTTITPIAISLLIYFACKVEISCYTRDSGQKDERTIRTRYFQYFLYLTYLVLPSVTTVIFGMFPCQNVDGQEEDQYYLRNDLSISCSSERYTTGVTIAAFMIVIYPFGIPALYWWQLYLHRGLIMHRSQDKPELIADVAAKYGFLYESYEPRFWYWESVEAIRRIVLTGVLSVLSPSSSTQSVLGMTLSLLYIGLYSQCRPYENGKDDTLAFVGQYQIFWTFFGTLIIGNDLLGSHQDNTVAILIILGNLAILCVGSYYEITDYGQEVGGLESFQEFYFGYLPKLPSSSNSASKRAQENSAQRKLEKENEGGSLSRNSLALTQVGKEQEMDRSFNAKVVSAESQKTGTEDRFDEELKRVRKEGPDEATVSHEGLLKYVEYASMKKKALRLECDDKFKNLDGHLSRVKKRFFKVYRARSEGESKQVEMAENPMRDSADPTISRI